MSTHVRSSMYTNRLFLLIVHCNIRVNGSQVNYNVKAATVDPVEMLYSVRDL